MARKRVYIVEGDYWVVARSRQQAAAYVMDDVDDADVKAVPDDHTLTICDEDGENPETKTCREWCDETLGRTVIAARPGC